MALEVGFRKLGDLSSSRWLRTMQSVHTSEKLEMKHIPRDSYKGSDLLVQHVETHQALKVAYKTFNPSTT